MECLLVSPDKVKTFFLIIGSLMPQMVKNLLAMLGTRVLSLGQEDPLEKGMATHSSILAWRIPGTEEPHGLQSTELQRVGQTQPSDLHFHFLNPGESL